jgi:hypothetical protein
MTKRQNTEYSSQNSDEYRWKTDEARNIHQQVIETNTNSHKIKIFNLIIMKMLVRKARTRFTYADT